jgi:divalent metal cation (Fe/Co/Zn/Cd) transporter
LLGLATAFAGILCAQIFDMPELDGAASIGIALILGLTAIFLARETKGLLIGESALPYVRDRVLEIARADPTVRGANGVITVQLGPDQIVAALSVEFEDAASAPDIEACVVRIERAIKASVPEISALFVKPQTSATWEQKRAELAD